LIFLPTKSGNSKSASKKKPGPSTTVRKSSPGGSIKGKKHGKKTGFGSGQPERKSRRNPRGRILQERRDYAAFPGKGFGNPFDTGRRFRPGNRRESKQELGLRKGIIGADYAREVVPEKERRTSLVGDQGTLGKTRSGIEGRAILRRRR